mgnify:CR=1 FL=1
MKLNALREDLYQAVQVTQYSSNTKGMMPILSGVKLEGKKDRLSLYATDLESYTQTTCAANITEEGDCVVSLKVFLDFLRDVKEDKVNLQVVDNEMIVEGENTLFRIYTMPAEDFPASPVADNPVIEDLEGSIFISAVQKVSKAASKDEKRPTLMGIFLEVGKEELRMVSTDSYRLAIKKLSNGYKAVEEGQFIIPSNALVNLTKIAGKEGKMNMLRDENGGQVRFDVGNSNHTIRLIEGKFPKYSQFIPEVTEKTVVVEKNELLGALRRVSIFSGTIKLSMEKGAVTLSGESKEIGEGKEKIEADYDGEEMEIAFNNRFLEDGISCIDGEKVVIGLTEPLKPGIIKEKDKEDFTYVIMPIRLK